ncbi:MAG: L,D-transpeptidase [Candidatus Paceibacterota bacterium]
MDSQNTFVINGTFDNPIPSTNKLKKFVEKMEAGFSLQKILVNKKNKKATFYSKFKHNRAQVTLAVNLGKDNKTPVTNKSDYFLIGNSRVKGVRIKIASNELDAVMTRVGYINLGVAFVGFDAVDAHNINRGIGFHGSSKDELEPTDGCIRMYNSDLKILYPFMIKNIKVFIVEV